MTKPSKNGHKTADGKFAPGNRLGRGRPAGGRNKTSLAIEALLDGEADAPTSRAIEMALKGDTAVLRLAWNAFARPDGIGL